MTTDEMLAWVQTASYEDLLRKIRFEPIGSEWMSRDQVYKAIDDRMKALRNAPGGNAIHVAASKKIGWGD